METDISQECYQRGSKSLLWKPTRTCIVMMQYTLNGLFHNVAQIKIDFLPEKTMTPTQGCTKEESNRINQKGNTERVRKGNMSEKGA